MIRDNFNRFLSTVESHGEKQFPDNLDEISTNTLLDTIRFLKKTERDMVQYNMPYSSYLTVSEDSRAACTVECGNVLLYDFASEEIFDLKMDGYEVVHVEMPHEIYVFFEDRIEVFTATGLHLKTVRGIQQYGEYQRMYCNDDIAVFVFDDFVMYTDPYGKDEGTAHKRSWLQKLLGYEPRFEIVNEKNGFFSVFQYDVKPCKRGIKSVVYHHVLSREFKLLDTKRVTKFVSSVMPMFTSTGPIYNPVTETYDNFICLGNGKFSVLSTDDEVISVSDVQIDSLGKSKILRCANYQGKVYVLIEIFDCIILLKTDGADGSVPKIMAEFDNGTFTTMIMEGDYFYIGVDNDVYRIGTNGDKHDVVIHGALPGTCEVDEIKYCSPSVVDGCLFLNYLVAHDDKDDNRKALTNMNISIVQVQNIILNENESFEEEIPEDELTEYDIIDAKVV